MAVTCSLAENKRNTGRCKNVPGKSNNEDTLHHRISRLIRGRSAYSNAFDNAIPYKSAVFKRNCKLPQLPVRGSIGIDTCASRYPWLQRLTNYAARIATEQDLGKWCHNIYDRCNDSNNCVWH
jgi:hypothetical protein